MSEKAEEKQPEVQPQEEKKTKKTRKTAKSLTAQPETQTQPQTSYKGQLNAYGFIHLSAKLIETWGLSRGKKIPVSIEFTSDGNLLVKKA